MEDSIRLKAGSTSPGLRYQTAKFADGSLIFAGASVKFSMVNLSSGIVVLDEVAATVYDDDGILEYAWQATNLDEVGSYRCEFKVTYTDGTVEYFPRDDFIGVEVVMHL